MASRAALPTTVSAVDNGLGAQRLAALLLGVLALLFYAVVPAGFMPMTGGDGIVRIMPCPQQSGAIASAPVTIAGHDMAGHATASGKSKPSAVDHGKCAFGGHGNFAATVLAPVLAVTAMAVRLLVVPPLGALAVPQAFPPRPLGQAPPALT